MKQESPHAGVMLGSGGNPKQIGNACIDGAVSRLSAFPMGRRQTLVAITAMAAVT
jgi:hypothetical protein